MSIWLIYALHQQWLHSLNSKPNVLHKENSKNSIKTKVPHFTIVLNDS